VSGYLARPDLDTLVADSFQCRYARWLAACISSVVADGTDGLALAAAGASVL